MAVDEFIISLTSHVRDLISDGVVPNWETKFYKKVEELAEKFNLTGRSASFVLGEDITNSADVEVQTDNLISACGDAERLSISDQCVDEDENFCSSERRVWQQLRLGNLKPRELEREFDQRQPAEAMKSVRLRRRFIKECLKLDIKEFPYKDYNYSLVYGACCENVFGYVPLPTGIAGPLRLNDEDIYVPMSTTEGALVASVSRGCKAINFAGGVDAFVKKDGMTRAPVIKFDNLTELRRCVKWLEQDETFVLIKEAFDMESRFAQLQRYELTVDEPYLFIRFVATTGDAMGMNMVTKCAYKALGVVTDFFAAAKVISISGNMCVDKKASRLNWERGRGKSVVASITITAATIKNVFRIGVDELVALGYAKFELGARHAGCVGGANAHAANIVAAVFIATGQDAAQVVSSSMCSTVLRKTLSGDLKITCEMPCMEVGTVGGGTILPAQQACLHMLECCGGHPTKPGENAKRLAKIICGAVLAGELSLLASQCAGDLMTGHIKLNRSSINLNSSPSLRHASENMPGNFFSDTNLVSRLTPTANNVGAKKVSPSFFSNNANKEEAVEEKYKQVTYAPAQQQQLWSSTQSTNPTIIITGKVAKKLAARCDHLL